MAERQLISKDGAYIPGKGLSSARDSDKEFAKVKKLLEEFYPGGKLTLPRPRRWYWEIDRKDLVKVADFLFNTLGCRFSIATGADLPRFFTITYHFSLDRLGLVINLRVSLSHDDPKVDSLTALAPGFEWIEREMQEILGLEFTGLTDTRHLLLPEDSPPHYHPYRRSFG